MLLPARVILLTGLARCAIRTSGGRICHFVNRAFSCGYDTAKQQPVLLRNFGLHAGFAPEVLTTLFLYKFISLEFRAVNHVSRERES